MEVPIIPDYKSHQQEIIIKWRVVLLDLWVEINDKST